MEPVFLTTEEVALFNLIEIQEFGGELVAIRDQNMLESAVNTPKQTFGKEFLHTDIYAMAAAYLYHIAKNHPFVDGNKRTAVVSAAVFLELNGLTLEMEGKKLEEMTQNVVQGSVSKEDVAQAFRENCSPLEEEESTEE